ncbi:MerR family transcriptional regulator [Hoyosella subflava]|uniref:MerR family transcriptional regulator n=1 Tax=Hoyosella subflava (strain DSM 45089 / JCM 17490 / NBRC 109087 / DQS3-9A1) TaxID=443218 RepID=F6EIF4_HOYSD|nr:MerR family transcriptional regulator [Hoyosella subflava]AEF42446.1 MerR family transcriptional regulator [Hoyosella subflava DQS3-9A1]
MADGRLSGPLDPGRGVYAISVAAELSGVGVQMLRHYERLGLLAPERTAGGTRRYSEADLALLARIGELVGDGVNLAGVAQILALEERNRELEAMIARLRSRKGM